MLLRGLDGHEVKTNATGVHGNATTTVPSAGRRLKRRRGCAAPSLSAMDALASGESGVGTA
jgi:hypothetical protein